MIEEEALSDQTLTDAIHTVWEKRKDYIHAMESSDQMDAVTTITDLIEKLSETLDLVWCGLFVWLKNLRYYVLIRTSAFCLSR